MDWSARIILADEDHERRRLVRAALATIEGDVELTEVSSDEDLKRSLAGDGPTPVVIAGVGSKSSTRFHFLETVVALRPSAPTVVMADAAEEALVVDALRGGAGDLVVATPSGVKRLLPAVATALEEARVAAETESTITSDPEMAASIVDALDTLVVVVDPEGRIVHFNRACEAATGFTAEELRGRRIWDALILDDERESVIGVFTDLLVNGNQSRHLNHWLTKDGPPRLISWSNAAVGDRTGRAKYVIGTGVDVTDRRDAKAEAASGTAFFEALVDTMSDALIVDDVEGRVTYVNSRCCELFGYSREEMIGQHLAKFLDPASVPVLLKETAGRFVGRNEPYELIVRRREGNPVSFLVAPQALRDADGERTGSFAVLTDLTAIRRTEAERSLLATAIEQSGESVIITGTDGEIRYVNPAFEEVTGYSQDEAIGSKPSILKSGRQDDAFYRDLWKTITAGEVWTGTFINRAKDGTLFEEDGTISPVRDECGNIVAFVAVKRDVSEERLLAKQLERAQKLEAVGLLAGGIAHDFNNLLMAIAGSTEVLGLRAPKEMVESAEMATIRKTVERGAELTRRLLSVARQQSLELARVDLNEIVERELDILRRIVPESINIEFSAGAGPLTVRGDRGQLAQTVMNLVINARDALPDGGRIELSTVMVTADALLLTAHPSAKGGKYVRLTVEDNGIGMDADVRDHVFEPFFSNKNDPEKSGLGLATAYGVVRQHHGMINLESSPGAGTRFDIYLPAAAATAGEVDSEPEIATAGGGERILVVEDEPAVRHAQVEMLSALGYEVREAENGRLALEVLKSEGDAIDLVLSDVTMPEMGGRELYDQAHQLKLEIPFVFSSGYTGNEFMNRLRDGEHIHFIAKPYSLSQLAGIIRKALAESAGREA